MLPEILIRHRLQFSTGHAVIGTGKTDLPGDIHRRERVVPGDHDHPDPGSRAHAERFFDLRPDRVGEPDKAEERKGEIVLLPGQPCPGERGFCNAQNPESVGCHEVDLFIEDLRLCGIVMAEIGNGFRCPFCCNDVVVPVR